MLSRKSVLVVGATGYLGYALTKRLIEEKCSLICLARNQEKLQKLFSCDDNLHGIVADVSTFTKWEEVLRRIEIVYWCSAQTSAKNAEDDPNQDININIAPFVRMLKAIENINKRITIFFPSAATVYGAPDKVAIYEDDSVDPITIYDLHKIFCEQYLKYYSQKGTIDYVSFRLANVYGRGNEVSSGDRGILNKMVDLAMNGQNLAVWGDGGYKRDYIHIDDVVEAFLVATIQMDSVKNRSYLIASGKSFTIKEAFEILTKKVNTLTKKNIRIDSVPIPLKTSQIDLRNFVAGTSVFSEISGWRPKWTLEEGLEDMIQKNFADKKTLHE